MKKTKSSVIYDRTKNVDAVRRLLGQSSVTTTSAYFGISEESIGPCTNHQHLMVIVDEKDFFSFSRENLNIY